MKLSKQKQKGEKKYLDSKEEEEEGHRIRSHLLVQVGNLQDNPQIDPWHNPQPQRLPFTKSSTLCAYQHPLLLFTEIKDSLVQSVAGFGDLSCHLSPLNIFQGLSLLACMGSEKGRGAMGITLCSSIRVVFFLTSLSQGC